MSRVVCIVQARMGSKRLPGKVLLPLPNGRSVIGEVLSRCKAIRGVDEVVCAVPVEPHSLVLEARKYCHTITAIAPENDVLSRYMAAARETEADVIMRVTGDCPLISPELCAEVLWVFRDRRADYASNVDEPRTFPKGLDCEVFSARLLNVADKAEDLTAADREHVTTWMRRQTGIKLVNVRSRWPIGGRLCLDTEEDYKTICAAFWEGDDGIS